tara:strand:- start:344 stop:712 length:369 start_codon:yes stop_codon:yes gene_type:complete
MNKSYSDSNIYKKFSKLTLSPTNSQSSSPKLTLSPPKLNLSPSNFFYKNKYIKSENDIFNISQNEFENNSRHLSPSGKVRPFINKGLSKETSLTENNFEKKVHGENQFLIFKIDLSNEDNIN